VEQKKVSTVFSYIKEIGKWALLVWLLWPLTQSMNRPASFPRIMVGILLFILFAGKTLYDSVFENYRKGAHRNKYMDLLIMVGTVTVVAILIGAVVVFTGLYIYETMKSNTPNTTGETAQ